VITFGNATVTYPGGVTALRDVSLQLGTGEFVVIVGLSGAGKSTLIRVANGLVPLTSGSCTVDGEPVDPRDKRAIRALRADVGMIFQSHNLVKRTTVLNNVLMGRLHRTATWRTLLGRYTRDDVESAMRALERVEIVEKAYTRAANLSGGQQQRVGIARALAQEPKVVLADEPTASLDPPTSHIVMKDLKRICRDLGITMLVNLHFLDLARAYGDRIVGLRAGELVYDGPAAGADEDTFREIYGRSLTAGDLLENAP
jgi:phosphonate transport system ATP-binding protein